MMSSYEGKQANNYIAVIRLYAKLYVRLGILNEQVSDVNINDGSDSVTEDTISSVSKCTNHRWEYGKLFHFNPTL